MRSPPTPRCWRRLEAVATSGADELEFHLGPLTIDFATFVGLRGNEHTMHTWDVEVALRAGGTAPGRGGAVRGRPPRPHRPLHRPPNRGPSGSCGSRRRIRPGASWSSWPPTPVAFSSGGDGPADLSLPAEAWARLVYGRLDADHTPPAAHDPEAVLDVLRRVYPGP